MKNNLSKGNLTLTIFMAFLIVLIYVYGFAGILNTSIKGNITDNANTTTLTKQTIIFAVPFFFIIIIASYWWFIKGEKNEAA